MRAWTGRQAASGNNPAGCPPPQPPPPRHRWPARAAHSRRRQLPQRQLGHHRNHERCRAERVLHPGLLRVGLHHHQRGGAAGGGGQRQVVRHDRHLVPPRFQLDGEAADARWIRPQPAPASGGAGLGREGLRSLSATNALRSPAPPARQTPPRLQAWLFAAFDNEDRASLYYVYAGAVLSCHAAHPVSPAGRLQGRASGRRRML